MASKRLFRICENHLNLLTKRTIHCDRQKCSLNHQIPSIKSSLQSRCMSTISDVQSNSKSPIRPETAQAPCMTDIGTRKCFSEEHDIFRRTVRRFMEEEVVPRIDEFENAGLVSKDIWEKAGSHGLLGINTPAEFGGIGADFLYTAIVQEEICYANFSTLGGFFVHSDIVMPYICHHGSTEQINKYIPDMTAGRKIGAIAMTEPAAGSDLQGVKTYAKKDGEDWILNGSKVFITNGINCDSVILVAKTDLNAKSAAHGTSLFIVDADSKGFDKGKNLKKIGLRSADTSELFFDNIRLSPDSLLGKENKGFFYLMQELPQERLGIAVMGLAHCEFMFEETRKYIKERKAFGKSILNFQTVQHKMAEMKTEICIGRTFVDQCLVLHNEGLLDAQMASMVKWWVTELQNKVAAQCLQLHGGWGYMMEYPIARAYTDARVQTIYGGTTEIMKELIARSIVQD